MAVREPTSDNRLREPTLVDTNFKIAGYFFCISIQLVISSTKFDLHIQLSDSNRLLNLRYKTWSLTVFQSHRIASY